MCNDSYLCNDGYRLQKSWFLLMKYISVDPGSLANVVSRLRITIILLSLYFITSQNETKSCWKQLYSWIKYRNLLGVFRTFVALGNWWRIRYMQWDAEIGGTYIKVIVTMFYDNKLDNVHWKRHKSKESTLHSHNKSKVRY